MHRAPFSATIEDDMYYSEPTRAQRLDILLHLTQYAHELLLIAGEEGSGKTTLLGQFLEKTRDNWKICRIDAFPMMHEEQILQRIHSGFGIPIDEASGLSTVTTLKRHIDAALVNIPTMVLIVDNVHVLPINVIGLLLEIANTRNLNSGKGLRTLFFCEPQIKILLASPELQDKQKQPQRKIDLPNFDENHTGCYLRHRLSQAGMVAERFLTDSTITKIHKQSGGIPGKINAVADKLLFETTPIIRRTSNGNSRPPSQQNTQQGNHEAHNQDLDNNTPKKPTAKFKEHYVLAAVVTGFIIAIVLFQEEINNLFHTPSDAQTLVVDNANKHTIKPLTLPETESPAKLKNERYIQGTLPTTQNNNDYSNNSNSNSNSDNNNNNADKITLKTESPPAITAPTLPPSTPTIKLPTTSRRDNDSDNHKRNTDFNPDNNLTGDNPLAKHTPAVQPQKQTVAIPTKTHPVAITDKTPQPTNRSQTTLGLKDEQWLLTQNPDHYTLQLVAGHHKSTVVKFIDQYQLTTPELSYFYSHRNGKNWHNLLHGIYPNRKTAANAIASLPIPLTTIKPWIRSMESIQIDIYRTQQ